MNKKIYQLFCAGLVGFGLAACSPDEFNGADPNGLPSLSGEDFTLIVDQEVNQIQVSFPEKDGVYPVWIFNGATYSTLNNAGWANTDQGTYTVEMKLGNRNGISQSSITKTFTFNETKVNWTNYFNRITGKEWRIDYSERAHLACGELGSDGTNWWAAAPEEKKGFGVYDDRLTFTADNNKGGTFIYNPGPDGMTYVNTGTTFWGHGDADFDTPTQEQVSGYHFERDTWTDSEGQEVSVDYLVLDDNTLFPYISSDLQYAKPRFRIETLTASKMVLLFENNTANITWRFILTSKDEVKAFEGFDPNSDFNMWKNVEYTMFYYYAPNWNQIADPDFQAVGNDYTITLPEATFDQWQAQVAFKTTNISTSAAHNYDFSCILTPTMDINGVTVKLVMDGDDGVFYFADRVDLKSGQDYIFWKSDMPGIDMERVNLFFDFGGNPAGEVINIRNIVLKDHANDDGTVLPEDGPAEPEAVVDWNENSAANLWKPVEDGTAFISVTPWFADNGWSQIADPEWKHENGVWEVTMPEGMGGSQWQGQFPINTSLKASLDKKYNFYCVIESDYDLPGVTIKLTETDDPDGTKHDGNFFFADRHDIKAGKQFVYKAEGVQLIQNDAHALSLFFDFGGSPVGATVSISKIYFEEAVEMNYNDADNLWKSVDEGSAFISITPWFANDSWAQIADPEWSHSGSKWELTIPEGMGGSQWQGQFPINTTLTAALADSYNFQCTVESENDIAGVTIKLTETDDADGTKHDGNFFFADRHDVKGGEPFVYKATGVQLIQNDAHALSLFFDFGGAPAGTNIVISDIIFEKVK